MSLELQYSGFLKSNTLWNSKSLFGLSQFDFTESINAKHTLDNKEITIKNNEVLGKRIERFFEYYIKVQDLYKIIVSNLQIFKEQTTIGELDFLIENLQDDTILHIELVYKFYLYDPGIDRELSRWIGPNRKDSLLEKVDKLINKQLPLLFRPESKTVLDDLNLKSDKIDQQVCFLANLFVPYSLRNKKLPHINNDCVIGYWIKFQEFIPKNYASFRFYVPEKKEWVIDPKYNESWFSFHDIYECIQSNISLQKSPLLWIKTSSGDYERVFIVWW